MQEGELVPYGSTDDEIPYEAIDLDRDDIGGEG
jgi:hypothetical protein